MSHPIVRSDGTVVVDHAKDIRLPPTPDPAHGVFATRTSYVVAPQPPPPRPKTRRERVYQAAADLRIRLEATDPAIAGPLGDILEELVKAVF